MDLKELKERLLRNKIFWGCLTILIILPVVGLVNQNGSPIYGKSIQTIAYLKAGNELFFEVRDVAGVKDLRITLLEDLKGAKVLVEEIKEVSWDFSGVAYSQFRISSADAEKIGKIGFTLKINEDDLDILGLSKSEVKLHLAGEELETELTKIDDGYLYYEASSEEMGEFVIGKAEEKEEPVAEPEPEEEVVEPVMEEPELEQPTQLPLTEEVEEEKKSLFSRIVDFFKNLFR